MKTVSSDYADTLAAFTEAANKVGMQNLLDVKKDTITTHPGKFLSALPLSLNGTPVLYYPLKRHLITALHNKFIASHPQRIKTALHFVSFETTFNHFLLPLSWHEKNYNILDPQRQYAEIAAKSAVSLSKKDRPLADEFWHHFFRLNPTEKQLSRYKNDITGEGFWFSRLPKPKDERILIALKKYQDYHGSKQKPAIFITEPADHLLPNASFIERRHKEKELLNALYPLSDRNNASQPDIDLSVPYKSNRTDITVNNILDHSRNILLKDPAQSLALFHHLHFVNIGKFQPEVYARAEFLTQMKDGFHYHAYKHFEFFSWAYLTRPEGDIGNMLLHTQISKRQLGDKNEICDINKIKQTTQDMRVWLSTGKTPEQL